MVLNDAQRALVVQAQTLPTLIAYEYTSVPHVVAELVSVGHLALCKAACTWEPRRSPWLSYARLAVRADIRNALVQLARQQGRELVSGSVVWCVIEQATQTSGELEASLEAQRVLELLDEPHRSVFGLHVLGGVGFRSIGPRFGKSSVWAWRIYHEALVALRERIEAEEGDLIGEKDHAPLGNSSTMGAEA